MKLKDIIKQLRVFEQQTDSEGHDMIYEVEYKDGSTERFNHREWNIIVANGKFRREISRSVTSDSLPTQ